MKAMLSSEDGGRSSTIPTTYSAPMQTPATHPLTRPASSLNSSGQCLDLWNTALSIATKAASDVGDGWKEASAALSDGYGAARQDFGNGNVLGAIGDLSKADWGANKAMASQVWTGVTDGLREGNSYGNRLYSAGVDWGTQAVNDRFGGTAGNVFHDGATWVGDSFAAHQATNLGVLEGVADGAGSLVGGTVDLSYGVYDYHTQGREYQDGVNDAALNIAKHPDRVVGAIYHAGANFAQETWDAVETGDNEQVGRNAGRLGFEIASVCVVPEASGAKLPGLLNVTEKAALAGLGPRTTSAIEGVGRSGDVAIPRILDDAAAAAGGHDVRTLVVGGGNRFRAPTEGEVFLNIDRGADPHITGDMRQIPMDGGQFDHVFFENVQYSETGRHAFGLADPKVLSEAFRMLKPGGELAIKTGAGLAENGDARNVAVQTLRNLGFENVAFSQVEHFSSRQLSVAELTEGGFGITITARKPAGSLLDGETIVPTRRK